MIKRALKKIRDIAIGILAFIVFVIVMLFCVHCLEGIHGIPGYIRWIFSGNENIYVAEPHACNFYMAVNNHIFNVYHIYDDDFYGDYYYDGAYHLFIDEKYFNNNDVVLAIMGDYYNYPRKPQVKVNGMLLDDVSISDDLRNPFDEIYFDRTYRATFDNKIEEGKVYEIYIRCGGKSETVNLVFHNEKNEDHISKVLSWGAWYVRDGELKGKLKEPVDLLGTYRCTYLNEYEELETVYWKFTEKGMYMRRHIPDEDDDIDLSYEVAEDYRGKMILYLGEGFDLVGEREIVEISDTGFKVIIEDKLYEMVKIEW